MEEFKYHILNTFFFFLFVGVLYWSFQHIDRKVFYQSSDVIAPIENNLELDEEVKNENRQFSSGEKFLVRSEQKSIENDTDKTEGEKREKEEAESNEKKNELSKEKQDLLKKLKTLLKDNVYMKNGSKGTRVGTVQNFLNLYFKENIRIDNDYGPKTIERVKEFQKREGLDADGFAGPQTYKKMISLLEGGKL